MRYRIVEVYPEDWSYKLCPGIAGTVVEGEIETILKEHAYGTMARYELVGTVVEASVPWMGTGFSIRINHGKFEKINH